MSPSEGLQSIVSSCLGQLLANDHGILESDDPEYIHQARVAIRRLRSAFSLFRPLVPRESMTDLLDRFRELAETFGQARDRDVFLLETLPPVLSAFGDSPPLARLRDHATASANAARAAARQAGSESAYAHLLLDMVERMRARPWEAVPHAEYGAVTDRTDADVPTTMKALAVRLLQRQYKRVKRRGATADRHDPQSLHALRIEIKKLRYAAEFFAALFPAKAVRRFVAGSAELQDILGRLNDESVTDALLQSLDLADAEMSHAGGIIRGWTHARAEAGLARFDKAWRAFARLDRFW
jgi:CHAD domain-containing protein